MTQGSPVILAGESEVAAELRASLPIFNPATGAEIRRLPLATQADVENAVAQAGRALAELSRLPEGERAALFARSADLLQEHIPQIAAMITEEQGKPLSEAVFEVEGVVAHLRWASGRVGAQPVDRDFMDGAIRRRVLRQPVGVVAIASPWNYPLAAATDHAIVAVAAGCTTVVKPPETCPSAFVAFARIILKAGFPAGTVNVVTGDPADIVSQLIAHPDVRKLAYTGSTQVGRMLAEQAARYLKPTILELGGNAPVIVTEDADVEAAVAAVLQEKFSNAGQSCIAPNRIYVQKSVYGRFCDAFIAKTSQLKTGNGHDPDTAIGPLATARQRIRIRELLRAAQAAGDRIAFRGENPSGDGYFLSPAVATDVSDDSPLFSGEIFGPVAAIAAYDDDDAVIRKANACAAGLAGYVFAGDAERGRRLALGLDTGMVGLNTNAVASFDLPFGGVKDSGWGYVFAGEGLSEFTRSTAFSAQ